MFGSTDVTKPCKFAWLGDIYGPEPYKLIGFRLAFISQTPAASNRAKATLFLHTDTPVSIASPMRRGSPSWLDHRRKYSPSG